MNRERVKIIDSSYHADKDLIVWKIQFLESGKEQVYCYPAMDLVHALGVKAEKIPAEHLNKFAHDMKGKEINFEIDDHSQYTVPSHEDRDDYFKQQMDSCFSPEDQSQISQALSDHFEDIRKATED